MSKPVHDAMNGTVYIDDRQVRQAEIVHLRITTPMVFPGVARVLVNSVQAGRDFVYVRLADPLGPLPFAEVTLMTFEEQLASLAGRYAAQGYMVTAHPGPDDLPEFVRAFVVQLCCRRGGGGVLVAAFADRSSLARDLKVAEYAEATDSQAGWRFDLALLGPEVPPPDPVVGDAHDLPADQIESAVRYR